MRETRLYRESFLVVETIVYIGKWTSFWKKREGNRRKAIAYNRCTVQRYYVQWFVEKEVEVENHKGKKICKSTRM